MRPHASSRSAVLLLALSLLAPALAHAQAKLRVVVKDEATGAPVAKAEVALGGGGRPVLTDSAGEARFSALPAGKHSLKVTRPDYRPQRVGVELSPGTDLELEVALALAPVALPGVDVRVEPHVRGLVDNGFYRRRERGGGGTFLDWNDLARWRGSSDVMRVIQHLPGFDIRPAGGDTAMVVLSTRGLPSLRLKCRAQLLLDGMVVTSRVVSGLSLEQIAGIEGYPGPATTPAIFNQTAEGTTCGTIAVWTRRGSER